ncbi:MAG: GatB/YqeY domain-containing protein [Chloroflexi bacterium]|nr:GatB/YqeY domain-containing protein [Chloroflexota bacterium]
MSLIDRINEDLKEALRQGDILRRDTLRLLLAAIRRTETAREAAAYAKQAAQSSGEVSIAPVHLSDEEVLDVIRREVRQRQESIAAYRQAGRTDLAEREAAEMEILQRYLPRQLSREEIAAVVQRIIDEVGARGPADLRLVMPRAMQELRGKADGREVNAVATELLARRE